MNAKSDASSRRGDQEPSKPDSANPTRRDDVGAALKTVYGDTLKEDVPSEMLDLLNKLG